MTVCGRDDDPTQHDPRCPHGEPVSGCPDTYPNDRPQLAALRELLHRRRAAQEARNADRYAEAIAGARALRADDACRHRPALGTTCRTTADGRATADACSWCRRPLVLTGAEWSAEA